MTNELEGMALRKELLRREEREREADFDRESDDGFVASGCCAARETSAANLKGANREEKEAKNAD